MESSILNAIGIDPGIIIIIVLVAILFLFMYMIKVSMSMSRFMKKYKIFMRGQDGISLERSFINKFRYSSHNQAISIMIPCTFWSLAPNPIISSVNI